jgi:hypothetical protein
MSNTIILFVSCAKVLAAMDGDDFGSVDSQHNAVAGDAPDFDRHVFPDVNFLAYFTSERKHRQTFILEV